MKLVVGSVEFVGMVSLLFRWVKSPQGCSDMSLETPHAKVTAAATRGLNQVSLVHIVPTTQQCYGISIQRFVSRSF